MHYTVSLLTVDSSPTVVTAAGNARRVLEPYIQSEKVESARLTLYGLFMPLFGLASNQVYAVTCGENRHELEPTALAGVTIEQTVHLEPTVRPTVHTERTEPGIYVFRWFDVYTKDIEEIVRLSSEAWISFEGGFDTEVQGLFCEEHTNSDECKMLLITWYKDLATWEASRQPSDEAKQNFMRRAELTIRALPVATRLA